MLQPRFDGNRVRASLSSPSTKLRAWRPIAASLAGVVLSLVPASAIAEPNIVGPPPRAAAKEVAGTLMIVGGGKLPDAVRDHFVELAGGKKGRLVYIPTASATPEIIQRNFNYWKAQTLASVTMLDTLDAKTANDPAFVKPLTEATAAWLGGGDQSRLANAYRGTAVERELRRLLARGGVVGGTSAGAAVMSSVMITGGNPQARVGVGFGLLPDVVIDQHFENRKRQQRLLGVLTQHPSYLGLGIDEQTAVVVRGHTFTVVGNANVLLCLPPLAREPANVTKVLKSGEAGELLLARLKPASDTKTASKERPGSATTEASSKQHSAP
ncbi:MAG TPA: cyanophycinase [Gemmataceae bacterium]